MSGKGKRTTRSTRAPANKPPTPKNSDAETAPTVEYFIDPETGKRMKRTRVQKHAHFAEAEVVHATPIIDKIAPRSPPPPKPKQVVRLGDTTPFSGDLGFSFEPQMTAPRTPSIDFSELQNTRSLAQSTKALLVDDDQVSSDSSDHEDDDDPETEPHQSIAGQFEDSAATSEDDASVLETPPVSKTTVPVRLGITSPKRKGPGRPPLFDPDTEMEPADALVFWGLMNKYALTRAGCARGILMPEHLRVKIVRGPNQLPKVGGESLVNPTCREGANCIFGICRCAAAEQLNAARDLYVDGELPQDIFPDSFFLGKYPGMIRHETLVTLKEPLLIDTPVEVQKMFSHIHELHTPTPLQSLVPLIRTRRGTLPRRLGLMAIDILHPEDFPNLLPVVPNFHGMGEQLPLTSPYVHGKSTHLRNLTKCIEPDFISFAPKGYRVSHFTHFVLPAGTHGGFPNIVSKEPYLVIYWTYTNLPDLKPKKGELPSYWLPQWSDEKPQSYKIDRKSIFQLNPGQIYAVFPTIRDSQLSSCGVNEKTECKVSVFATFAILAQVSA